MTLNNYSFPDKVNPRYFRRVELIPLQMMTYYASTTYFPLLFIRMCLLFLFFIFTISSSNIIFYFYCICSNNTCRNLFWAK